MSAAQALTSLRSKHLRTIEVLKETTAELDVLKKKFGNRGNYIDEDERERIKDSVRKVCNEELQKMEAELSNARDTIQLLTKEKNAAYEKIKDLENSSEEKVKQIMIERDNAISNTEKLNEKIGVMKEEHDNQVVDMTKLIENVTQEKKVVGERLLEAEKKKESTIAENERLGTVIENLNKKLREFQQSTKNQKDLLKRTKSMENMFKKLEQRATEYANENKDLLEKIKEMEYKLDASNDRNKNLEKSQKQLSNALEHSKQECKRLENVWVGEIEKKEFLEKSLAVAKSEWERLVQENARLTDELELLKASTSNNTSRFAQFVELKEENSNLARKHNKLQKQHKKLKKVSKKAGVLLRQQMPQTENRNSNRKPQPPNNVQSRNSLFPTNTRRDGSR
eukprot:g4251.t1